MNKSIEPETLHMFDALFMEPMNWISVRDRIPNFIDIPVNYVRCAMCNEFICDDKSAIPHVFGLFVRFLGKRWLAEYDAPALKHHRSTYYMCEKCYDKFRESLIFLGIEYENDDRENERHDLRKLNADYIQRILMTMDGNLGYECDPRDKEKRVEYVEPWYLDPWYRNPMTKTIFIPQRKGLDLDNGLYKNSRPLDRTSYYVKVPNYYPPLCDLSRFINYDFAANSGVEVASKSSTYTEFKIHR